MKFTTSNSEIICWQKCWYLAIFVATHISGQKRKFILNSKGLNNDKPANLIIKCKQCSTLNKQHDWNLNCFHSSAGAIGIILTFSENKGKFNDTYWERWKTPKKQSNIRKTKTVKYFLLTAVFLENTIASWKKQNFYSYQC